ncbi:peptidoglycan-binding domain-containing protein [Dactylosporangium sp. NPDC005572]|uniref:peptidoglycan-binding domain-containing protein n=1 Tax=Dactylosporangium sp. NPDC005572 TaxID=3156889 RepID=UPI0033BE2C10
MSANRRRRGRAGKVVVAAVTVAAAGAVAAAALGLPDRDSNAQSSSQTPVKTAKVSRQTLVDTQTEDGKVGHGDTKSVAGRLQGTVTELPAVGATVQRGQAMFRVDDTPVVLLYGALPAYRTLAPGVEGADVKQFEQNLAALGYTGFTVDDEYTASTATAVRKWQGDLGITRTGTVEQGRIVYAAGAARIQEQKAAVGDQAGTTLLTYTGTGPVVTVELEVALQRLAKVGAAVTVKLPDGRTVPAKISQVETVIKPAEGQNPATTKIQATVVPDDGAAFAGLDQVTCEVVFTSARKENVLAVPIAALLALAEGGYGLQVVENGATRVVAVETGMFAAGKVEVSGDGVTDGTVVGMPS